MTLGVMRRFAVFLRHSRWGGLPRSVLLIVLGIVVFCVVLLPSIVFPVVGLYLAWRLPRLRKMTLYATYIYLVAALAALWWLEMALSDRGIDYYGTGYIGIVPSAVLTGLTAVLLVVSFVDTEGRAQFK